MSEEEMTLAQVVKILEDFGLYLQPDYSREAVMNANGVQVAAVRDIAAERVSKALEDAFEDVFGERGSKG